MDDSEKLPSGDKKPLQSKDLRFAYGRSLRKILESTGVFPQHYAGLGVELAKAQIPERAIPYNDFTIEGWCQGELLPTPQAQEALYACLDKQYGVPENVLDLLDLLHDGAWQAQSTEKKCPTELSHALTKAVRDSGLSQTDLTLNMVERNKNIRSSADERKLPETRSGVSLIMNGANESWRGFIDAVDQLCRPTFSLRAIHENMLRERADQLWLEASRPGNENLGGLIRACRVRLGLSLESFSRYIGAIEGKDDFGTAVTAWNWEQNINLPVGSYHEKTDTLYTTMVRAMQLEDERVNSELGDAITIPWFDEEKEATFHRIFTRAVENANDRAIRPKKLPDRASGALSQSHADRAISSRRGNGREIG